MKDPNVYPPGWDEERKLDTGTLRAIIRDAGLSVAEFAQLL